jgi:hypothetical protein
MGQWQEIDRQGPREFGSVCFLPSWWGSSCCPLPVQYFNLVSSFPWFGFTPCFSNSSLASFLFIFLPSSLVLGMEAVGSRQQPDWLPMLLVPGHFTLGTSWLLYFSSCLHKQLFIKCAICFLLKLWLIQISASQGCCEYWMKKWMQWPYPRTWHTGSTQATWVFSVFKQVKLLPLLRSFTSHSPLQCSSPRSL